MQLTAISGTRQSIGEKVEYKLIINEEIKTAEVDIIDENNLQASIDKNELEVSYSLISDNQIYLTINGQSVNAFVADGPDGKTVLINGTPYLVQDADTLEQGSKKRSKKNIPTVITPATPSVVISVLVKERDTVEKGQGVIVLSAMKMETTLKAAFKGTVTAVNAVDGDKVAPGDILIDIQKTEEDQEDSDTKQSCNTQNGE